MADHFSQDLHSLFIQWFGFRILPQTLVERGQVVQAYRVSVARAENFLPDLQRLFEQRFGLGIRAHIQKKRPEIVQACRCIGMLGPNTFW